MFFGQTFVFMVIIGSIWFFDGSAGLLSASDGEPILNDNSNSLDQAELSPTTVMPPKPPSDLTCDSGKLVWKTSLFEDVPRPNSKGYWVCEVPKRWEGSISIQKWSIPKSRVRSNDDRNQEE